MKTIKYIHHNLAILFVIILSGALCSCTDMNLPSTNSYSGENVFVNLNRAEMATLACYRDRSINYMKYFNYTTDEAYSTENNSKSQFANYVVDPNSSTLALLGQTYALIEKTNICISNIPKMDLFSNGSAVEQNELRRMLGEALTLRAFYYLDIVRYWGDVPFPTQPTSESNILYTSRVSRDTIYDHLISDLQSAVDLVPWQSQTGQSERITKQAVKGIMARVALYAAGYSLRWDASPWGANLGMRRRDNDARIRELYAIAETQTQDIINAGENSLNPSFQNIFYNYAQGKLEPQESIFEFGYSGLSSNNDLGYNPGMMIDKSSSFMKTFPLGAHVATYYYDFAKGDTRRDVTLINYEIDSKDMMKLDPAQHFYFGKWRVAWNPAPRVAANKAGINLCMLRYADVLLMNAESQIGLDQAPSNQSLTDLAMVRARAFNTTNIDSIKSVLPTDHDGFLSAIIRERALELGDEGYRRTDLVRWNVLDQTLADTKAKLIRLSNRTGEYSGVERARDYKATKLVGWGVAPVSLDFIPVYDLNSPVPAGYTRIIYTPFSVTDAMISNFASGFEKNKSELLPFQQSLIDQNTGLAGQQHPSYGN